MLNFLHYNAYISGVIIRRDCNYLHRPVGTLLHHVMNSALSHNVTEKELDIFKAQRLAVRQTVAILPEPFQTIIFL